MIKWVVFAGNYREYTEWCRRTMTPLREAKFVAEAANLNGIEPTTVRGVIVGTFLTRSDAKEIVTVADARGFSEPLIDTTPPFKE